MYLEDFYGTKNVQDAYQLLLFRYNLSQNKRILQWPRRHILAWFLVHVEEYPKSVETALEALDSCTVETEFRYGNVKNLFEKEWQIFKAEVSGMLSKYQWENIENRVQKKKNLMQHLGLYLLNNKLASKQKKVPSWELQIKKEGELIQNYRILTEKALELLIFQEPSLIEEGLIFTARQVIVKDGRIDLVGRDKAGNPVICEVKIEEDKDVLWQASHYPKAYQEKYGYQENLRMLVVAPGYEETLKACLFQRGAELYIYKQMSSVYIERLPAVSLSIK